MSSQPAVGTARSSRPTPRTRRRRPVRDRLEDPRPARRRGGRCPAARSCPTSTRCRDAHPAHLLVRHERHGAHGQRLRARFPARWACASPPPARRATTWSPASPPRCSIRVADGLHHRACPPPPSAATPSRRSTSTGVTLPITSADYLISRDVAPALYEAFDRAVRPARPVLVDITKDAHQQAIAGRSEGGDPEDGTRRRPRRRHGPMPIFPRGGAIDASGSAPDPGGAASWPPGPASFCAGWPEKTASPSPRRCSASAAPPRTRSAWDDGDHGEASGQHLDAGRSADRRWGSASTTRSPGSSRRSRCTRRRSTRNRPDEINKNVKVDIALPATCASAGALLPSVQADPAELARARRHAAREVAQARPSSRKALAPALFAAAHAARPQADQRQGAGGRRRRPHQMWKQSCCSTMGRAR